ncbi:hypothetical protein EJB05_14984, partial [Eragrostis curvula]
MSSDEEATSSAEGPSPPPCAACKHLRRRCVPSCAFAAYFPPDHGDQFAAVHKVFGASNVSKLLAEVAPAERVAAVESLVYEARARLQDPAFGCVSYITVLEHMLKQGMGDVAAARGQLAAHVGAAAAFRPFEPARASPEAKWAGEEQLDATLRFAKEQDDKMRAVRVAVEAKRKQGCAVAWKDAVKRGQGQPLLNRHMAEAQQAAAAAQSAREKAMMAQQAAAPEQQHRHRAVAQHAGTGQGYPDGHVLAQQMVEASESAATAQAAREQSMMARQAAAAAQQKRHVVAQHGTGLVFPDGHYAAMGREHPHSHPRAALQMAHRQQLAAAEDVVLEQEMMMREAAAAPTELMGFDATLLHGLHSHHPDLHQQTVTVQQASAAAEVAREHQGLIMQQQQQHAATYAHAMPGATNMAFLHPGGSADAEAFLVQPQKVNALALQTDSSLPPSLANLQHQQQIDGTADHDDKLSDLTAMRFFDVSLALGVGAVAGGACGVGGVLLLQKIRAAHYKTKLPHRTPAVALPRPPRARGRLRG